MRKITREELDIMLKEHALWLEDHTKGKCAYLSYCNLRGVQLNNMNLRHVKFDHSCLINVNFNDSHVEFADFRYSCLNDARFADTHAEHALFGDASLVHTFFCRTHLEHASFNCALVEKAYFQNPYFENTDLDFASLPLACRGLGWHIDKRLAAQLAYHFCSMKCDDMQVIAAQNALIGLANESHLICDHNLEKLEQKSIDDINRQE